MPLPCRLFLLVILAPLRALPSLQAQTVPTPLPPTTATPTATPVPGALPLSLAQATALAQQRSPLVAGAQARLQGAVARLRGASAQPNPTLALAQPFGSNTGGLDEGIVASQTIELAAKRRAREQTARAERDTAVVEQGGVGVDLTTSVASAYYEALRAGAERALAVDALNTARTLNNAAQTQFQAGDVARSNVLRTEVELERAEQALATADTEQANRYATLRSLCGLQVDTPLTLTDTLAFTPMQYQATALRELALAQRTDLSSARLVRLAREGAVGTAKAARRPDLFVEGRRHDLSPTSSGSSLRVGVIFPLLDYGRDKAAVQDAEAAVREQQATLDETTRAVLLDVDTALLNFKDAQRIVESFQKGRLDRVRELRDMMQTGYEHGASSYLEVLDAQQVYRTEQTDYARALATWNIARATLEKAVGGKLP